MWLHLQPGCCAAPVTFRHSSNCRNPSAGRQRWAASWPIYNCMLISIWCAGSMGGQGALNHLLAAVLLALPLLHTCAAGEPFPFSCQSLSAACSRCFSACMPQAVCNHGSLCIRLFVTACELEGAFYSCNEILEACFSCSHMLPAWIAQTCNYSHCEPCFVEFGPPRAAMLLLS